MGLFDKVLGTKDEKMTDAEGFAGIALCAVAADGVIEAEEQVGLFYSLRRMKLFGGMNQRDFERTLEKTVKTLRSDGFEAAVKRFSEAVKPDLRPTAFAIAADLMMADGHVDGKEKEYLEKIQRTLGVDDATALKIVEVVSIKNRG